MNKHHLLSWLELDWCRNRPFRTIDDMVYFSTFLLWRMPADTASVVLLDEKRQFIRCIRLTEGMLHKVNLLSLVLQEETAEAYYLFLCHTHGIMATTPSPEDIYTTRVMVAAFPIKPKFLEHIVVNYYMEYTHVLL